MKLTSRQDIEATPQQVFGVLSDFSAWERAALRRGADVSRQDRLVEPGPGMEWRIRFDWRGRQRDVQLDLTRMEAPSHLTCIFMSGMFEGSCAIEVFEMAARRSRIHVAGTVKPRTLAARLMLQSLRLARGKVERRFDNRIAALAADIEHRLGVGDAATGVQAAVSAAQRRSSRAMKKPSMPPRSAQ